MQAQRPGRHLTYHGRCPPSPFPHTPLPRRTLSDCRIIRATGNASEGSQLRRPEAAVSQAQGHRQRSRASLWRNDRAAVERGGWLIDGSQRGMLEAEVGIRCWTDSLPGFTGILKQRCAAWGDHAC